MPVGCTVVVALRVWNGQRASRCPFLRHYAVSHVGPTGIEADVRKRGEDPFQDLANGVLADTNSAARVVLEDGILGVHRQNCLYVVAVPGLPVGGNDFLQFISAVISYSRQCLYGDRGYEAGQQDAAHAYGNRQHARDQELWREIAVADRQAGDEGKVDRLLYRPAFESGR